MEFNEIEEMKRVIDQTGDYTWIEICAMNEDTLYQVYCDIMHEE